MQPHRYYHTLNHIQSCLDIFDEVSLNIPDIKSVELALWFHDIIYNPIEKDNEDKSSLFAKNALLKFSMTKKAIEKVCRLIQISKHPSLPKTLDEEYMVDIDLFILGSPQDSYENYSQQIRKEYSHVPESMYYQERKKVLLQFLKAETIFHTDYFQDRFELAAQKNIQHEISSIEALLST